MSTQKKNAASRKRAAVARTSTAEPAARRPRIQDVATHAAVSLGTVSAVLNSNGRVSDETRERVQEAIRELGYRPSLYASNLARRDTRLLGLVVSDLQNPFFAETAHAIEQEATRRGYQLSLMTTNFDPAQQQTVLEQMLKARVSGLAVMTSEHDDEARQLVLESGVPAVFLDLERPEANVSTIMVDARGGMQAAVEHLLSLGHRRLLFVKNSPQPNESPLRSHIQRDEGFKAAVRSSKLRDLRTHAIDVPGPGAEAGERAIVESFETDFYSAVIAATDNVALGVYRGLQRRKLRIPDDVSVVGFDDTYFSRFLHPPLTTVEVPRNQLSSLVLAALTQPGTGESRTLATRLILRESTAIPGARS